MEHNNIKRVLGSLKKQEGFIHIAQDGVVRIIDRETYEVKDTRGLNQQEIAELLDLFPKKMTASLEWEGVDSSKVTSHEGLYHPAEGIIPKKPTEDEAAEMNRIVAESHKAILEARAREAEQAKAEGREPKKVPENSY